MSKIGCLCLKHTYLRELYAKYRTGTKSSTTEKLASEKRWMDVVVKSSSRVHARACGVNENDYLLRWFDEDYWRMEYYNFMRQQSPELSAEDIWTFDVIQFPYNTGTNMLRAPEKVNILAAELNILWGASKSVICHFEGDFVLNCNVIFYLGITYFDTKFLEKKNKITISFKKQPQKFKHFKNQLIQIHTNNVISWKKNQLSYNLKEIEILQFFFQKLQFFWN